MLKALQWLLFDNDEIQLSPTASTPETAKHGIQTDFHLENEKGEMDTPNGQSPSVPSITRWGIVGTSGYAYELSRCLMATADCELVAIAPINGQDTLPASWGDIGDVRVYRLFLDLLRNTEVDVVYVATSREHRASHCVLAFDHNKHVVCEAPMGMNVAEVIDMLDMASHRKLLLLEALPLRFSPAFRKAKELIRGGAVGEVKMAHVECGTEFFNRGGIDGRNGHGGVAADQGRDDPVLIQMGMCAFSLASLAFGDGEPPHIQSVGELSDNGNSARQVALVMKQGQGQLASISCSTLHQLSGEARIHGTQGSIQFVRPFWHPRQLTVTKFDDSTAPSWSKSFHFKTAPTATPDILPVPLTPTPPLPIPSEDPPPSTEGAPDPEPPDPLKRRSISLPKTLPGGALRYEERNEPPSSVESSGLLAATNMRRSPSSGRGGRLTLSLDRLPDPLTSEVVEPGTPVMTSWRGGSRGLIQGEGVGLEENGLEASSGSSALAVHVSRSASLGSGVRLMRSPDGLSNPIASGVGEGSGTPVMTWGGGSRGTGPGRPKVVTDRSATTGSGAGMDSNGGGAELANGSRDQVAVNGDDGEGSKVAMSEETEGQEEAVHGEEREEPEAEVGSGLQYVVQEVHQCLRSGRYQSPLMSHESSLQMAQMITSLKVQLGLPTGPQSSSLFGRIPSLSDWGNFGESPPASPDSPVAVIRSRVGA